MPGPACPTVIPVAGATTQVPCFPPGSPLSAFVHFNVATSAFPSPPAAEWDVAKFPIATPPLNGQYTFTVVSSGGTRGTRTATGTLDRGNHQAHG